MKFEKQMSNGRVKIPASIFKVSGFGKEGAVELHGLEDAVVVLKKEMTAKELLQAAESLHQLSVDLLVHLAKVCGFCDGCDGECPFGAFEYDDITLPDDLREEAGIPAGAKLCAYVDEEENTVTICEAGYDHDLRDVPPNLVELFANIGVCLGELEERLMVGDTVYGA